MGGQEKHEGALGATQWVALSLKIKSTPYAPFLAEDSRVRDTTSIALFIGALDAASE